MSEKNAHPPDNFNPESIIIDLLALIPCSVRQACHVYGHNPSQDEVADISQSIVLLLIDDNYRRLRSFGHQSSLKTWLQTVINHYVLHYLRSQKGDLSMEHVAPDDFAYQPDQEEKTLFEERLELLDKVVKKLTKRERKLFELVCQGRPTEEIANQMGVKVDSIYKSKHALIRKFQKLLKVAGGQHRFIRAGVLKNLGKLLTGDQDLPLRCLYTCREKSLEGSKLLMERKWTVLPL